MKNATYNDIIKAFRDDIDLSLQEFARHLNDYLGENIYSRDAIYRMDSQGAKVSAEFMMHVSQAFDVPIDILMMGKAVIAPEDMAEPPALKTRGAVHSYRQYVAHVKGIAQNTPSPLLDEVLAKLETVLNDHEDILRENDRMRGMVEAARRFVEDAEKRKEKRGKK